MQASIVDILEQPTHYADQIVNVDGILFVTDYDRDAGQFQQVWLVKPGMGQNHAIRAQAINSDSSLWHGLSRLNPRHRPGFPSYRVHDALRACVRVEGAPKGNAEPRIHILTAAVYRREFTLYVGEQGVRLDQALPAQTAISSTSNIQADIARYLGRRCHVYGTLVIRSAPPAQFLLPGRIPYAAEFRSTVDRLTSGDFTDDWLADIEYPQDDSPPPADDALPDSIHIDLDFAIKEQLAVLPGINQTLVKPAIVVGTLGARDHEAHFATLTDLEQVYLQNICYGGLGKSLESVLKLKNFAELTQTI